MREAIGGTWIMQLVIVFMLLFVAFLALALNYSKAFQVKNDILSMIEKKEGVTKGNNGSLNLINKYLKNSGYNVTNTCPENSYGVYNLNNNNAIEKASSSKKYYYCVQKVKSPSNNNKEKVYYKVETFFYFNLPVIGDLFKFRISGTTNDIIVSNDGWNAIPE